MKRKSGRPKEELSWVPLSRPFVDGRTYKAVEQVLKSGWWTMGAYTRALEAQFQVYTGAKHAVAVSSCSAALHLAVKRCRGRVKDLVAVTPMTFCSTVNAIVHNGMIPFFVDIDRRTGNIDPYLLEEAVRRNPLIRGVVIIHFAGRPCDMDRIMRVVNQHGLFLVEDCAHAVEATWRGRHVGTFGGAGCFSFNPIKNVAAPEMGMITTDDEGDADYFRSVRLHGLTASAFDRMEKPGQYDVSELGYKYNPTDVEAVIALHQLEHVELNHVKRMGIWLKYLEGLEVAGSAIAAPFIRNLDWRHALHLFVIFVGDRDRFVNSMRVYRITCGIHYKPVHLFSYMEALAPGWRGRLPEAEWWGEHVVSLPMGPGLTDEEVERVIETTNKCLKEC